MKNAMNFLSSLKRIGNLEKGNPKNHFAFSTPAILLFAAFFMGSDIFGSNNSDYHMAIQDMPAIHELGEGWQTLEPGGRTACAHGTPYTFFFHKGDPKRLLIFLYGGGGCWDAETCQPGSDLYREQIEVWHHPGFMHGILKHDHPDNPFAGFTMLGIPVCTGDVHLGDNDKEYQSEDGKSFTIFHRGKVNAMSAIDWLESSLDNFDEIIVAGSSAGAVAVPFYANVMATRHPDARVTGFGDDASSYGTEFMPLARPSVWGIPQVLQPYPGWEEFAFEHLGIEVLYSLAGRGLDNLRMFLIDHANDGAQLIYLKQGGTENPDLPAILREMHTAIQSDLPDTRSFLIGGMNHGSLQVASFYMYRENNVSLRDWVAAAANWEDVPNVSCYDLCLRPGMVYFDSDLKLLDNALAFLEDSSRWNDHDDMQPCPNDASASRNFRCVIGHAVNVTGDKPAMNYGATHILLHEMAERMGRTNFNMITVDFNNSPDTNFEVIRSMLKEIRDEIAAQLEN